MASTGPRLGEPELRPYTNSGPSAERHVRVSRNLPISEKPRRIEGVRVGPTSPVTVQHPGRNDDQGFPRDFDRAAAIGPHGLSGNQEGGRVETQRLGYDRSREGQPLQGRAGGSRPGMEAPNFLSDACLRRRRRRHEKR